MKLNKTILLFLILAWCFHVFASDAEGLLKRINETDNATERAELYLKLGDVFEYSDPAKAIEYYRMAFNTATSVSLSSPQRTLSPDADLLRAKSLRYIGIVYSDQGDFDNALEAYFESKDILTRIKSLYTSPFNTEISNKIAKVLNNIGIVYSRQGAFGVAKDYYAQALDVYTELQDSLSIAITYSSMGIAEARVANLTEALSFFHQALTIYTSKNNAEGMAQSFNNIGGIYVQLSDWEEALRLYNQAHDLYEKMGHKQRVAATKSNIGLVFQLNKEHAKALEFFTKSLEMRLEINDQVGIIESYNHLGDLHTKLHKYPEATNYYQKTHEKSLQVGDQRMIALSLINIGKTYSFAGNHRMAISKSLEGLEVARQHDLKFAEQYGYKHLSDHYASAGDYQNAYENSLRHFEISQQILDEQKTRQLNELGIEYKAREKQQLIEMLEKEGVFHQMKLRQSRTLLVSLALIFFIGLLISIFSILLLKQRGRILLLKKENEAEQAIQKTVNDLRSIIKTHAHGMILLDAELKVIVCNDKAKYWCERFIGDSLRNNESIYSIDSRLLKEVIADVAEESLKGESIEVEKEISHENQVHYFKFYGNPVFEEKSDLIQSVSVMIEDITDRKLTEERILSDLKEKETLVKEIHHRVKNNFQVIISLIRMQTRLMNNPKNAQAFEELEQRLVAMSYVHEDLYASENLADIDFESYLRKISSNLCGVYQGKARINNHFNIDNPLLNIDIAMPCGLIVNELVSNSFKHAFKGKKGESNLIEVHFRENAEEYELAIVDNGLGMKKVKKSKEVSTMGFNLIDIIVEDQLKGRWDMVSNGGLKVEVVFPKNQQG
jgi:two-component sensor histidine kinase/tetratricopeptide (TPR) repeat protein